MKYNEITLYEVAEQGPHAPIWALNNIHKSHVGSEGDFIIGLPRLNGSGVDVISLDRTWLPTDLTAQVPRAQLLQSSEFRASVTKGYIVLLTHDSATKILQSTGADDEARRLEASREYIRTATGVQNLSEDMQVTGNEDVDDLDEEDQKKALFSLWVGSLENKDDTHVLSELKTRVISKRQAKVLIQKLDPVKHIRSKNLLIKSLQKKAG